MQRTEGRWINLLNTASVVGGLQTCWKNNDMNGASSAWKNMLITCIQVSNLATTHHNIVAERWGLSEKAHRRIFYLRSNWYSMELICHQRMFAVSPLFTDKIPSNFYTSFTQLNCQHWIRGPLLQIATDLKVVCDRHVEENDIDTGRWHRVHVYIKGLKIHAHCVHSIIPTTNRACVAWHRSSCITVSGSPLASLLQHTSTINALSLIKCQTSFRLHSPNSTATLATSTSMKLSKCNGTKKALLVCNTPLDTIVLGLNVHHPTDRSELRA